jgi:hypothetical protein
MLNKNDRLMYAPFWFSMYQGSSLILQRLICYAKNKLRERERVALGLDEQTDRQTTVSYYHKKVNLGCMVKTFCMGGG